MRFRALKWLTMALASAGSIVFALATTSTEAVACFGRCCGSSWGGCRPVYRPVYYGPMSRCGSGCWSGCQSGCAPCGLACSACDSGCSPCASGGCGVAPASGKLTPTPDPKWNPSQRTYAPESNSNGTNGAAARTQADSDIDHETRKAEEAAQEKANEKEAADNEGAAAGRSGSAKGRKKGPAIDPVDETEEQTAVPVPTVSIDEKIVWRPAPIRKRSEPHHNVANARLVRLPAYAKSGWLPADASNVASK